MIYDFFVTRTRRNGTRTVYGVTGEEPPEEGTEAGGYLLARILWDDAFPEDVGGSTRIYKPSMERHFEERYDVSKTRPPAKNFGEAAAMVAGRRQGGARDYA